MPTAPSTDPSIDPTAGTDPRRNRRLALIVVAVLLLLGLVGGGIALAASDDSEQASHPKKEHLERAAARHVEASTTTEAPVPPTTAAPATCDVASATAALGASGHAVGVQCAGDWAAGSASNGTYDFGFLLHQAGGQWTQATQAQLQDACTTNTMGLPQELVNAACND